MLRSMSNRFQNVGPLLSRCSSSIRLLGATAAALETPPDESSKRGRSEHVVLMIEIRKKILTFRDVIDLPPCDVLIPFHELIMGTVEDLHNLYPKIVSYPPAQTEHVSLDQGMTLLYKALISVGESWAKNHKWLEMEKYLGQNSEDSFGNTAGLDHIGHATVSKLEAMTTIAKRIFDVMEEDEMNDKSGSIVHGSTIGDALTECFCDTKLAMCSSPDTPTSVPPLELREITDTSHKSLLLPFRLKALENLQPTGITRLFSFDISSDRSPNKREVQKSLPDLPSNSTPMPVQISSPSSEPVPPPPPQMPSMVPSPPPPPQIASMGPPPAPLPPPMVLAVPPPAPPQRGLAGPPPPPPLGAAKALRPKKATTKLKRSSHMGSMYRALKGRVEGAGLNGKLVKGKRSHVGGRPAGGKQGMADALAEMTRRSSYFQQIEEDVQKHSESILEIKAALNSFQTKDMAELVKFHKYAEQHLEKLIDETQVLGRFEGFPTKKLESLRTATALYLKLEEMLNSLQSWKVAPPLGQVIDKVEAFFNKIKGEIDALERSKEEESKRFQSHNITFDFNILVRIKESMVDVSSSCMELALQDKKNTKMHWRAFQLAFRVYSFAGGQDERADVLTKQLAHEIQTDDQ